MDSRRTRAEMLPSLSFCLLILLSIHPRPAISGWKIGSLPGFPGPLPFSLETGYVAVGESKEDHLFYYFIESERNPEEDPLLVWFSGGPGCSSWTGLAFQIGPLYYLNEDYNGSVPALGRRQESWTKVASIIFVDSPVWAGFSYSSAANAEQNGDLRASKEAHEFLLKWYADHPQFLSNPLYIGGDSYSGVVVPVIAQEIANGIEDGMQPVLNLKGYMVGNPLTDRRFDGNSKVPYLHRMAILSDELYQAAKENCGGDYLIPSNPQCAEALDRVNKCTDGLNTFQILEPSKCILPNEYLMEGEQRRSLEEENWNRAARFIKAPDRPSDCRSFAYTLSNYWANDQLVQKVIRIRQSSIKEWRRCNSSLSYVKDVDSSIKYHRSLTMKGYRALVYSGDHDATFPYLGTEAWIRTLNYSIVDDWRPWTANSQVAGYTRTYTDNLTFATVKGGGHTAPVDKPKECLAMVDRWMSEKPL